jgi:hypothetical protein
MTDISKFIGTFDGGARPNLFEVSFNIGGNIGIQVPGGQQDNFKVFCKASSIPSTVLGTIPVNFMGRVVNIPGDRTYEDWTVTIINDEQMQYRKFFEDWNHFFNQQFANTPKTGAGQEHMDALSLTTATVKQLKRDHTVARTYTLSHIWCENVAAFDVSYDTPDTISEFQVTFKYHGLTITDGNATANANPGSPANPIA